MKSGARIQTTIEILQIIDKAKLPMDLIIGDYMRSRRFIGSKDRKNIVERVYNITRHYARLQYILHNSVLGKATVRAQVIAYLKLYEECDEKRLNDLFDGSKYAPGKLNEAEHVLIKNLNLPNMPDHIRIECPDVYREKLERYFGANFEAEMAAMIPSATLDLRVNTFVISRENAQASLKKDGVETEITPYSPWGLRCKEKTFISKTKAFNKGWVAIQDEGSQMIAHVCDAQPGMQVLDYCAGGGGKTLALAAAMQKKGRIVATDIDEKRLEKGRKRFKKSGLADIIEVRPLSDNRHRKWLRRQKETFDITLCDVPCSGTGTWRRNPDLRWNTYSPSLEELVIAQAEILDKVAGTVKPGGRLVYATCSLLPEENEEQIESFLKRNDGFEIFPAPKELGENFMRLTPHCHGTDGFFAAVLIKKI